MYSMNLFLHILLLCSIFCFLLSVSFSYIRFPLWQVAEIGRSSFLLFLRRIRIVPERMHASERLRFIRLHLLCSESNSRDKVFLPLLRKYSLFSLCTFQTRFLLCSCIAPILLFFFLYSSIDICALRFRVKNAEIMMIKDCILIVVGFNKSENSII